MVKKTRQVALFIIFDNACESFLWLCMRTLVHDNRGRKRTMRLIVSLCLCVCMGMGNSYA